MTIAAATLKYYQGEADRLMRVEARKPHTYGGNAQIATLRCFIRYHKDARQEVELAGRTRYLTHLQVATLGLVSRLAVTREHATITGMARELHCAPSTVSRSLLKFQAWGQFAIDVRRGKYGGVDVRLRVFGDQLKAYADRAWARIKQAAERALSRTKSNVASPISLTGEGYELRVNGLRTTYLPMDATLKPEDARGCLVSGCTDDHPEARPLSFTAREAAETRARAEAWATDVLRERARLAIEDPWGELDAEYPIGWARALRHGVG